MSRKLALLASFFLLLQSFLFWPPAQVIADPTPSSTTTQTPPPSGTKEEPLPWTEPAQRPMLAYGTYSGYSGLDPYAAFSSLPADEVFIADTGGTLDQYLCRSASPITFNLDINRVFGPIAKLSGSESYNNLQNPQAMIAAGLIAPYATLYMQVYDVDSDYQGGDVAPEVDQVSINGHKLTGTLTSGNNRWDTVSFQVPIDWLFYPDMAAIGSSPANAPNEIKVDIDVANSGPDVWCVEVDWAALHLQAARPAVLVNGILSNDTMAWGNFRPFLWQHGLPNYAQEVDATRGIFHNADQLAEAIPNIEKAFGVKRINIIAHSKGGLDSRAYLRTHNDVDTLVQLATPNRGSDCAQSMITNLLGSTWDLDPDWIHDNFNYRDTRAHWWQPHNYVPAWTELGRAPIYIFAGTALTDGRCPVGIGDPMDPPDDSVVSHDRATLPWNWTGTDGDGLDQGVTDAVGPYDHSSIHDSSAVADQAVAWIAASYNLGGSSPHALPAAKSNSQQVPTLAPLTTPVPERFVEQTGARITADQQVTHSFILDATSQSQVAVIHGLASTTVQLLGPDGSTIPVSASHQPVGANMAEVFNLTQPQPGTYTVQISAAADDLYELQVRTLGGPTLQAQLDMNSVSSGESTTLTATFQNEDGSPLTGAQVTAELLSPDGSRQTFDLTEQAGGSYATTVSSTVAGLNVIIVRAIANGVQRSASSILAVIPATAALDGTVSESTVDANGDGLIDQLRLGVGVNVVEAGRYILSGDLYDQSGKLIDRTSIELDAAPGVQNFPLNFSGEKIYASGNGGPFVLQNVVLQDATHDGLAISALETPYTTQTYTASKFQHRPLQVLGGTDQGLDSDGDGRFNALNITLHLNTDRSGYYQASGRLVTPSGEELDWGHAYGYLNVGDGTLTLRFDGQKIRAGGANGPYRLIDLMIQGARVAVVPNAYQTNAYDVHQFQSIGADLVVTPSNITTTPASPAPGQDVTLSATVENRGDSANGTISVDFYQGNPAHGGTLIGSTSLPGLAAESQQQVSVSWTAPAQSGSYEIYVVLNRSRSVHEYDYSNDTSFQVIEVMRKDLTPPVTTATEQPAPNAQGWHNAPAQVILTATDDASGVASTTYRLDRSGWQSYAGPIPVEGEGVHTLEFYSVDNAGNSEAPQTLAIRLDMTPPTVTIGGVEPGQVSLLEPITPTVSVFDRLDPAPTISATLNGQPYAPGTPVTAFGTYELTITATDAAGNTTSTSLSFTVANQAMYAAYLRSQVDALAEAVSQGYSGANQPGLLAKLREVSDKLARAEEDLQASRNGASGSLRAAANQLQAFENQLAAIDLGEDVRAAWTDRAETIQHGIAALLGTLQ